MQWDTAPSQPPPHAKGGNLSVCFCLFSEILRPRFRCFENFFFVLGFVALFYFFLFLKFKVLSNKYIHAPGARATLESRGKVLDKVSTWIC